MLLDTIMYTTTGGEKSDGCTMQYMNAHVRYTLQFLKATTVANDACLRDEFGLTTVDIFSANKNSNKNPAHIQHYSY